MRNAEEVHHDLLVSKPELDADEVTQIGGAQSFLCEPRWHKPEVDVSVQAGRVALEDAVWAAFTRSPNRRDRIRVLSVKTLRVNEFAVLNTGHTGNPAHASITAPRVLSELDEVKRWWSTYGRERLAAMGGGDR